MEHQAREQKTREQPVKAKSRPGGITHRWRWPSRTTLGYRWLERRQPVQRAYISVVQRGPRGPAHIPQTGSGLECWLFLSGWCYLLVLCSNGL